MTHNSCLGLARIGLNDAGSILPPLPFTPDTLTHLRAGRDLLSLAPNFCGCHCECSDECHEICASSAGLRRDGDSVVRFRAHSLPGVGMRTRRNHANPPHSQKSTN